MADYPAIKRWLSCQPITNMSRAYLHADQTSNFFFHWLWLQTSVVRLFWFFKLTDGFGSSQFSESKNHHFWFFEKTPDREPPVMGISATSKNRHFSWKNRQRTSSLKGGFLNFSIFFWELRFYTKTGLKNFHSCPGMWVCMQVDSWLVSVADSNTHTTLVQTLHVSLPLVWQKMVFVHDLLIGLLSSSEESLRKKKNPENPKMLSLFSELILLCGNIP